MPDPLPPDVREKIEAALRFANERAAIRLDNLAVQFEKMADEYPEGFRKADCKRSAAMTRSAAQFTRDGSPDAVWEYRATLDPHLWAKESA